MIFKARNAEELEERMSKLIDKIYKQVHLRSEVEEKVSIADKHTKMGLLGGAGVGAAVVLGGIATIAAAPAIAATAVVGGLTVAGVSIMGGGAVMMAGMGYAGVSALYKTFQESRLGGLTARIFEDHRQDVLSSKINTQLSNKMGKETNYNNSISFSEALDVHSALKKHDKEAAMEVMKKSISKVKFD